MFSQAGRETLIKVVALALPTYLMVFLNRPPSLCDEMESIMARLWRGGDPVNHKPDMIAKQIWRLISRPSSLMARVPKAEYYPANSSARVKNGASYLWRSFIGDEKRLPKVSDGKS